MGGCCISLTFHCLHNNPQPNTAEAVGVNGSTALHTLHCNKSGQQEGVKDAITATYESIAPSPSRRPRDETLTEFDNPLYSDTGPVTFPESNIYESVSY